jgi:V/A-type H+/Na+-transporting ATPase subunit I
VIAPMLRAHVAARQVDRERMLGALARLGVLHVVAVDPQRAQPDAQVAGELEHARRALQALDGLQPAGERPALGAAEAVRRTRAVRQAAVERQARLAELHRQLQQSRALGDACTTRLAELEEADAKVHLFAVPHGEVGGVRGRLVQPLQRLDRGRTLVAVVGDEAGIAVPDAARPVALPEHDRRALLHEAAELAAAQAHDSAALRELAHLAPAIQALANRLETEARWSVARRSGLQTGHVWAFEGWVPADRAGALAAGLEDAGLAAAVQFTRPLPADSPPTLIRYPAWARPVSGLFDVLNTLPGYREFDVSGFFMLALPVFAGMLIGDAGYGLLFLLPLLARRRFAAAMGRDRTHLLLSFGAAALVWGAITGAWFGVTPAAMTAAGDGTIATLGTLLDRLQLVRGSEDEMRATVIKVCFILGGTHLISAHIRRAFALAPDSRFLAEIGWCLVLAAMVGLIWSLFFAAAGGTPPALRRAVITGFGAGILLIVPFAAPHPNPLRRLGVGVAGSLLPLLNTFSDTLSYIRLMAVGLASHYIAAAFNTLGAALAGVAGWAAGGPVLLLGHLLNLGLIFIAIFAHGVRLNMLEFSSNAGVQWAGHAYRPFRSAEDKEI